LTRRSETDYLEIDECWTTMKTKGSMDNERTTNDESNQIAAKTTPEEECGNLI
jgi:hypothetical protein